MMFPLVILAIGAVLAGYINWPVANLGGFLGKSPSLVMGYEVGTALNPSMTSYEKMGQPAPEGSAEKKESPVTGVMLISATIALLAIGLAYIMHLKDRARGERFAQMFQPLTRWIEAKYWVDEIYQAAIVEPLRQAGEIFFAVDRFIVDGIISLIGYIPQFGGFALKLSMQRGYLQGYAATMLLGLAAILLIIFAH
jgi:NADH-quinone oxidoreductase subunit L